MALQRTIGLTGLTFIGMGGVLGSGWLFAPMLAAQQAGPAAILAWCIGGVAIIIVALPFAELTALLPEAGAMARLPRYSHGGMTSMIIGWSAWLGYATAPPIEAIAIIKYVHPLFPGIFDPTATDLAHGPTTGGYVAACAILAVMVVINALGVAWLNKANAIITTAKILLPLIIIATFLTTDFHIGNFTAFGGFAPYGLAGILSAVSLGGVVFAFLGFRHIIDLAGEASRPHFNVPTALMLTVVACFGLYVLLQVAFIGGVPASAVSNGWNKTDFAHHLGPLAGIAVVIGASWLIALIYGGAVLGPFGSGLIATGSNARLGMALAENGFFPALFTRLSSKDVPFNALVLGFAAGVCFLTLSLPEVVALNSSAIVLSLCIGPLAVVAMRKQLPRRRRPIRLPAAAVMAPLGFIVATLIIYWSGWGTIWRLDIGLAAGLLIYVVKRRLEPGDDPVDLTSARWLFIYIIGVNAVSYLGTFGGGIAVLPFGWDMAVLAAFSLVCFRIGLVDALEPARTRELVEISMPGP
ncbi:APC family permease [Microbaculum marinum]|uniref:APC family permease n=1 Tax=Microbaculum marinum TaxID=1764581 RepID=A0AAW9RLT9_9HYPH